MTADERFLDTQQIAGYLGVHEKQVYTLIHDRGLPATKITGKWLFPRHLVDRWLEASVINLPSEQPFLGTADELLLIAGSDDPLLAMLSSLFRQRSPDILVLQSRAGSMDGLMALKRGLVHIACVHLIDPDGGYTTGHLRDLTGDDIAVVTFAKRTQGVLLRKEGTKAVHDLGTAFNSGMIWAVRDLGTGTRALMEMEMDRIGAEPEQILPGSVRVQSHLDAALAIQTGKADAAFGLEAAAHIAGCDFIPVRQERFDLIIRKENFFLPQVQALLVLLKDEEFERMADSLKGYDLKETGKIRV